MIHVHILGSAAGGGFPQWNCNCANCEGLRSGRLNARPRNQSSIALSTDKQNWLLINASPDIRAQIGAFSPLQPSVNKRETGIRAVLLVDSQIDHTTGLLILREGEPLSLYCTDMAYDDLTTGFPVLNLLQHYCGVERHTIAVDGSSFTVEGIDGLVFKGLPLCSKAPPYSPHRHDPHPGDNIGLWVEGSGAGGGKLFYAPGLGMIEPHVKAAMEAADCVLVDGTFWTDDEMSRRGVGTKKAADMGHLALSGEGGMIQHLRGLSARKVLIHINNTNPILDEDSPERAQLAGEGIEVACDGMDLEIGA